MAAVALALPTNWAAWVDAVTLGDDPVDAAKALGYANPRQVAAALLRMPNVRKALVAASEAYLVSRAAPLAMRVVEEILADKTAPASVRGKMAIAVLDRIRDKDEKALGAGKTIGDMTVSELEAHVRKLEDLKGGALEMRDVTPRSPLPDPDKP